MQSYAIICIYPGYPGMGGITNSCDIWLNHFSRSFRHDDLVGHHAVYGKVTAQLGWTPQVSLKPVFFNLSKPVETCWNHVKSEVWPIKSLFLILPFPLWFKGKTFTGFSTACLGVKIMFSQVSYRFSLQLLILPKSRFPVKSFSTNPSFADQMPTQFLALLSPVLAGKSSCLMIKSPFLLVETTISESQCLLVKSQTNGAGIPWPKHRVSSSWASISRRASTS